MGTVLDITLVGSNPTDHTNKTLHNSSCKVTINIVTVGGLKMSAKQARFDWSILDRKGLISMLWQFYPEIVDKKFKPQQLQKLLSKHIKKYLPVRIVKKMDASVEQGWVYIGGCYYSDWDQEKKKCIEISFVYNPLDEYIVIDKNRYKRMCHTVADVVLHEIIHMRQYRRRKFKIIPDYESNAEKDELRQEQSYFGCSDEIDAYSFNIACELLDKFKGDADLVIDYVGKTHRRGQLKSNNLRSYLKAFEYNHNHPIIKRLKTRVIRYIPHALQGKPYRNKDWIDR